MHSLLKRQLRRAFGDHFQIPQEWQGFINAVNHAYRESDIDRTMLERSLDLSSQELFEANSEMRAVFLAIPDFVFRIDETGKILSYKAGATIDLSSPPKDLVGKRIQDIPNKFVNEKFSEALRLVQENKSVISVEYSLPYENEHHFYEARLIPLRENQIIVIIRNITERMRAEDALRKREGAQRFFSERLTRVLNTINELSKIESFDDLCRGSVELAIERLGFDRVGLCFFSEDQQTLLGIYGTDEKGRLRNEKHLKRPLKETPTVLQLLKSQESVVFFKDEALYNDNLEYVGSGYHAVARLWNGEKIIGIYAVDNLLSRAPITDEDLKVLDVYGTAMGHLFTLKRAEEDLFNSRQMLLLVLNTIPQIVFWKDRNSKYVGCNKSHAQDCGYENPSDLIGKTDEATSSAALAEHFRADDKQVIETGKPKLNYEESMVKNDGSLGWLKTSKVPLRDKDGSVIGVLGTYEDITEQKRALETLALFRHTIKSIGECISITDLKNILLYVNDAFIKTYGWEEHELIGKHIGLVTSDVNPSDEDILNTTLNGGWQGERLNRKKDGSIFPVFLSTSVVHDDKGKPVALVGVASDISERKHTEEQIRASLQEKEVLLKETHHRVKNNLQVISSLLSLQSEAIKDPYDLSLFVDSQARIKSMALIHEQLYRSRSLSAIDFDAYIRMLSTEMIRSYAKGSIDLDLDVEPMKFSLDFAIPCGLIVNELLSNALKHAFPNQREGIIRILLKSEGEYTFTVTVSDNGVGLPANIDLQNTISLGFQLIMTLTKQLQGHIEVNREGGTSVTLTFLKST